MSATQPGILAPVPRLARHLFFDLHPGATAAAARDALSAVVALLDGEKGVLGLGGSLIALLGSEIDGLRAFPVYETDRKSTRLNSSH
mgnify:CR=1 FL=1